MEPIAAQLLSSSVEIAVLGFMIKSLWTRVERLEAKINNGISERLARIEGTMERRGSPRDE
jgi:hypothetical protein